MKMRVLQSHQRQVMLKQLMLWVAIAVLGAAASAYLVSEIYPQRQAITAGPEFAELRSVAAGDGGIDTKYCTMKDTKVPGSSQLRKKGGCIYHELETGKGRRWYISSESTVMAASGYPENGFEAGTWHEWMGVSKPTGSFEEYIACRQCGAKSFQAAFDTPFATVTKPLICGGSDDYRGTTDQCGQGGGCSQGFYCASYGPGSWHKYCTGKTYLGCGDSEATDATPDRAGKPNQGSAKVTIANGVVFVAGYSSGAEPTEVPQPTSTLAPTAPLSATIPIPSTAPTTSVNIDTVLTPTDQVRVDPPQGRAPSPTPTPLQVSAGIDPGVGRQPTPLQQADSRGQHAAPSPNQSAHQAPSTLPVTGPADSYIPLYGSVLLLGGIIIALLYQKTSA